MKLICKLFLSSEYFTIGIRPKKNNYDNKEWSFFVPADKNRWFADPMIAEYNGKSYLFCEATEGMHGHIEVAEINKDGSLGKMESIISDNYHYSYPFVFCFGNEWYMIPESSDRSEMCLYKSSVFPYKWEKTAVLLNEKAVDTTVFDYEGKLYLLTYIINGVNEIVIPKSYELDMNEQKIIRELEWVKPDGLRTRGAGPFFTIDNKLFRPAQINTENSYGDGIVIYNVDRCDSFYSEKEYKEMEMITSRIRGKVITGMHTYTVSDHYEAVDVRVKDFDIFKPLKKIVGTLKRSKK